MMLIVLATTLGLSYLSSASVKLASSANLSSAARAKYLAESGVEHGCYLVRTGAASLVAQSSDDPLGPLYVDASGDAYYLWAETVPGMADHYKITARGHVGNIRQFASATVRCENEFRSLVLSYNPLCYWRLGESSGVVAYDEKWYRNGTYVNGVQLSNSGALMPPEDSCAGFDGADDHVDLGALNVPAYRTQLSIVAWVRRSTSVSGKVDQEIISKAWGAKKDEHYWMIGIHEMDAERRLRFILRTNNNATQVDGMGAGLLAGQWYFVAAVYDGATMKLYLDCEEIGSAAKSGFVDTSFTVRAWIGGNPESDTECPWAGKIDDIAIFSHALSLQQLRMLYNARYPTVEVVQWHE